MQNEESSDSTDDDKGELYDIPNPLHETKKSGGNMKSQFEDFQLFYKSSAMTKEIVEPKCVIPQDHSYKIIWDVLILMLLLIVCTIIPWRLAFDGENFTWEIVYYCIDSLFAIDIVLTFFTTIPGKNGMVEINDKKIIAREYLNSWFFIDFFSIVPFDTIIKLIT
jgi:hypothetical protein